METLEPYSQESERNSKPETENPSTSSVSPSPPPPASVLRLWRPAAQRNVRNQWSKMASYRQKWNLASSSGRSHATSLVNSYLSQRFFLFSLLHFGFFLIIFCSKFLILVLCLVSEKIVERFFEVKKCIFTYKLFS